MCTVSEDCCPPTETTLFTRSSKRTSRKQGHREAAAAAVEAGEVCCEHEGCCAPGRSHEAPPVDQMEFWGTEVTPGKPQVNEPGDDTYVHVSQAALGPSKDGKSERVVVRVESGGKNVVLGTLSTGKVDQMTLDLIFDREFKLSHTSTSSSVFFCGYRTDKREEYDDESEEGILFESDEDEDDDEDDDELVPQAVPIKENGTASAKVVKVAKKQSKVIEQEVEVKTKKVEAPKSSLVDDEADEGEEESDDDDDEDDEEVADKAVTMDFDLDGYDEEDDSEFEVDDMSGSEGESDEEDEDDSDEEEDSDEDEDDEDVLAAELGKKRGLTGSAKKTPLEGKKPRLDTPAKPGIQTASEYWESLIVAGLKGLITTPGKKGSKGAVEIKETPVSSKKSESKVAVAKTPQKTPQKTGKEAKAKTPKTDKSTTPGAGDSAKKLGAHTCADCNRNFVTESALSQHAVAKHKK